MKLTGIRHIYAILLFLEAAIKSVSAATPTAADILAKTSGEMRKAQSLKASFTVDGNGQRSSGEITIDGNRFYLTTPEMATWFDGKTQWTYNAAAEEVSMTEPTRQEILEVNPLAIISNVSDHYRIKSSGTDTTGKQIFRLTPIDNNTDITEATVYIEPKTSFPAEITVRTRDNSIMTIRFTETSVGTKLSPDKFRYKPAYHPKAEIIDLR